MKMVLGRFKTNLLFCEDSALLVMRLTRLCRNDGRSAHYWTLSFSACAISLDFVHENTNV